MCGRFSIVDGTTVIEKRFGVKFTSSQFETYYSAKYNAAPSMYLPMVMLDKATNEKTLVAGKWGLMPPWMHNFRPQANARLDTVQERKMFKDAFTHRHCLVPADSFFEWHREKGIRQPYRIMLKDESMFAMAGIWEDSIALSEPPTFALLTTNANTMMAKIHDRMPVIIPRRYEDRWLHEVGQGVISNIPMQYPPEDMKMYPVTTRINKVSYQEPDAIVPVEPAPSLGI